MKIFFLSVIILSGTMAQGQSANSQASQVITMRLQPISFIDFSSTQTSKLITQAAGKNNITTSSSVRDIIINMSFSSQATLPADASATLQHKQQNDLYNLMAYGSSRTQPVYTFSSR